MVDVVFQLMTFMLFSVQMTGGEKVDVPPARHGVGVEETAATFLTLTKPATPGGETQLLLGHGEGAVATLEQARQAGADAGGGDPAVFRVGRVSSAVVLPDPFTRPPDFDLAAFWSRWSASFMTSRPRLEVRVRASAEALAVFPEVFGDAVRPALDAATPADERGFRDVALTFEHEAAAVQRLAGFGGQVEVLTPPAVRARLIATARELLGRYEADG